METPNKSKIAIFVSFSGEGGVERMIAHLCDGFLAAGYGVDLLLIKDRGSALATVPEKVRRIKLGNHAINCLPGLVSYLRRERPDALLSSKHRANLVAISARQLSGVETRLGVKIETNLSASLARQNAFKRVLFKSQVRLLYPLADLVIGVSRGVSDDLRQIIGASSVPVHTIYNPVLPRDLLKRAEEPIGHPTFSAGMPVIVSAGRLTRQKDFATLLRAFAIVLRSRACRLLVLGDGPEMPRLQQLAKELDVGEQVDLHGFVENPFPYIAMADLFVLSSAWEGFGNVLVEAMALGTPVVSTDCPSGPKEILEGGRLGPLVPVGDPDQLAAGMLKALESPVESKVLRKAADTYSIDQSSRLHLDHLLDRTDAAAKESPC